MCKGTCGLPWEKVSTDDATSVSCLCVCVYECVSVFLCLCLGVSNNVRNCVCVEPLCSCLDLLQTVTVLVFFVDLPLFNFDCVRVCVCV